jgi:solute carrier family 25 (mitochondrial carnitine/acylcarnitine transporter), member 20/29
LFRIAQRHTQNKTLDSMPYQNLQSSKTASDHARDFMAGWIAGIAQVITGQPFDIVKVRLQSEGSSTSSLQCAREILQREGALAFYKGSLSPILGIGACVSVKFAANLPAQAWFRKFNQVAGIHDDHGMLPLWQYGVAGAYAGLATSPLRCPIENIRIRCQVQVGRTGTAGTGNNGTGKGGIHYTGSIDCARRILATHGISGWYKGMTATIPRDIIAYGGYFMGYEYLMHACLEDGETRKDASKKHLQIILCGAASGYAMWVPSYWIDTVKSKMQSDCLDNPKYKNTLDCIVKTYRAQGIRRGFFAGFGSCMVRAAPVNAVTFVAFEWAMHFMHSF